MIAESPIVQELASRVVWGLPASVAAETTVGYVRVLCRQHVTSTPEEIIDMIVAEKIHPYQGPG